MRGRLLLHPLLLPTVVLGMTAAASVAAGDEVMESISEAQESYQRGNYAEAIDSLNFAVGKIREKQQGGLALALPVPLEGWQGEDTQSEYAGAAFMGGGVAASRKYTKGGESVEISFLTDSPVIASMAAMMTNPMIVSQDANSKLVRIAGNKAIEKWEPVEKSGEISMVFKSTMLVTVKGTGLSTIDPVRQYANGIDYEKLKAFLMQ